jgi:hypothetical protein
MEALAAQLTGSARPAINTRSGDIIQEAFCLLDEAQEVVRTGMHGYFYAADGHLKCSEREVYEWVADRAIDEYKIGYQAGQLLQQYGHFMKPWLAQSLGKQVYEEMRHYRMLHHILPDDLKSVVESRMDSFPELFSKNLRWKTLIGDVSKKGYTEALLEATLVHEGFANAAIVPAISLPYSPVAKAYATIARDEQNHFDIGRRYVLRECTSDDAANQVLKVAKGARARAEGCVSYGW